jgi:hypothetical protein
MTVEDLVRHAAAWAAINEGQRVRTVPFNVDDGHDGVGQDATDSTIGLKVFELQWWRVPISGQQGFVAKRLVS